MMSVPVMTEQGLQYIPYDTYEGGHFLAYSPMGADAYSMPYPAAYGGGYCAAGWWGAEASYPEGGGMAPAFRPKAPSAKQHGRRRTGSDAAAAEADGLDGTGL